MKDHLKAEGIEIYSWAKDLFPICRSITGNGVRDTLKYIKNIVPELVVHEVPSGTKAFDWTVPDEWNIKEAFIEDTYGNRLVDFADNNLHVLNYSIPVDKVISLETLQKHLYSIPDRPNAIPYMTSYYERNWGFCISHKQRQSLKPGNYRVCIDSTLRAGHLTYGEIVIPGRLKKEVFLSTYICHPSLANNEISGPVVTAALSRWLANNPKMKYSYRIVFGPETIGAIVYISRNLEKLKKRVISGFNVSCIGDNNTYTFLASKNGKTLADRVAKHVLYHTDKDYKAYTFLDRGSDERQYCAPGVDLPMASIMRTRYGDYPEYHSSDDNLDFISPEGLEGGFEALVKSINVIEKNQILKPTQICEPQLGKRKLISNLGLGTKPMDLARKDVSNLLAFSDGETDLLDIAIKIERPMWELIETVEILKSEGLLVEVGEN